MKFWITLLGVSVLCVSPLLHAESTTTTEAATAEADKPASTLINDDASLKALCQMYAEEDKVAADKQATYVAECLRSMIDLSDVLKESVPLVSEDSEESLAAPSSAKVNQDPETLVKEELVETPDPTAETLETKKAP